MKTILSWVCTVAVCVVALAQGAALAHVNSDVLGAHNGAKTEITETPKKFEMPNMGNMRNR